MKKRQKTKHNDANFEKRIKGIFLAKVRKNKKKFLAALLAVAIASSGPTITYAQTNSETTYEEEYEVKEVKAVVEKVQLFNDVSKNHWAYESIAKLQGIGVIEERVTGKFKPNELITREEFTVLLMKTLGLESNNNVGSYHYTAIDNRGNEITKSKAGKFYDVWKYSPAQKFIAKAYEDKIINGVDENHFNPEGLITREQAAKIMGKTLENYYRGQLKKEESNFKDEALISSWAQEAIDIVVAMNIFNGMPDGSFDPKGQITNAQAAKVIVKVAESCKNIKYAIPEIDSHYKTIAERLKETGAVFGEWNFSAGYERTLKEKDPDMITLRPAEIGGIPFGEHGNLLTIAKPLTGNEEWTSWLPYYRFNDVAEKKGLETIANGTFEELEAKGLLKMELKEGILYENTTFEAPGMLIRLKINYYFDPGWRRFTYQSREIKNIEEVVEKDPSLKEDISYIQPIAGSLKGEEQQVIPKTLQKTLEIN